MTGTGVEKRLSTHVLSVAIDDGMRASEIEIHECMNVCV